jgi:predicted Rdx family selenoprotein
MILRARQLVALHPATGGAFEDRMLALLAAKQLAALGEPDARALIRRAVEAGIAHGIEATPDLASLVALMVEFGERFEVSPDQIVARQILEHRGLPGPQKVQILEEHLRVRTGGRKIVPART